MGEMADYMLNGDDCQVCGEYLGEGDGFPRSCSACDENDDDDDIKPPPKPKKRKGTLPCPKGCGKKCVDQAALEQHMAAKHPPKD